MHRISRPSHINKAIPDELLCFIIKRFQQLAEETDVPPIIVLMKPDDMIIPTTLSWGMDWTNLFLLIASNFDLIKKIIPNHPTESTPRRHSKPGLKIHPEPTTPNAPSGHQTARSRKNLGIGMATVMGLKFWPEGAEK